MKKKSEETHEKFSVHDRKPHVLGRPLDDPHRRLDPGRVEVRQLDLRDLLELRPRHRADLLGLGVARALFDAGRLLQQHRGGRRLEDEGEGAVLVDGDLDGDDGPGLVLGRGVVLLAKVHDVDSLFLFFFEVFCGGGGVE